MVEVIDTDVSSGTAKIVIDRALENIGGSVTFNDVSESRVDVLHDGQKKIVIMGSMEVDIRVLTDEEILVEPIKSELRDSDFEDSQTGSHSDYTGGTRDRQTGVSGDLGEDGSFGRVHKPFSHSEAGYREPGDEGFDDSHRRCEDCAHWDNNGNCHVVPDVESEGYCDVFYADVGIFGVDEPSGRLEVNLRLFGERFDWAESRIERFADIVKNQLKRRI